MKRPKRTAVTHTEYIGIYSSYTCPHCKVKVVGANINKHISRFRCTECGEECIVDHFKLIKHDT